ncbi:aminotransferase class III-fold pyridoxal phosphate-dependent enzyme, partial [bacterium 1XD42-8]
MEFLKSLRRITEEKDIALIFDEIITGFRICAGGSQEYFNIQADIVTFGKIIGGGMPIGIVSGKAKYLDSIDGGFWKFGDDSIPIYDDKKTFAAGTFCHHPMAMVAAHAVLAKIKENRDTMYVELNSKADYLIDTLNEFFDNEDIPFKGVHYGSLLRFHVDKKYEIFYYGIMAKGVYIWEGRNCFISTEHSKEDIDKIIEVVKETVLEMKDAGFFKQELKKSQNIVVDDESQENNEFPMSLIQQRLYSQILINEFDP